MLKFVMVPAGSLKLGDVVAPAKTPLRFAQPLAEANQLDDGRVELVFIEKSLLSAEGIRVAGIYADQYPCALVGGEHIDMLVSETVEKWLAEPN